jgi:uncharacterized linocin/CFP29 family protein
MRHIDALSAVRVHSLAEVLAAANGDMRMLRPFLGKDGRSYVVVNGQKLAINAPAALPVDAWRDIDRAVIEVFTERIQARADLPVYPLGSVGVTTSEWDRQSDMTKADVNMDGSTAGEEDTVNFDTQATTIPVTHKDFRLNWRRLEAARRLGIALDTAQARIAARIVAETNEDLVLYGSAVKIGTAVIHGYTTFPSRNSVDSEQWTAVGKTGSEIVGDVQAMLAAARADNRHGPFVLYIPGEYETRLDDDYAPGTSDDRTIRERIMQLSGLSRITVLDRLTNHNVLLVQLDRETADWAEGQGITTLQWDVKGGLQPQYKVMTVGGPRMKSDYDGRCGIVHLWEIP